MTLAKGPVFRSGAGDMLIASCMTATVGGALGRLWCGVFLPERSRESFAVIVQDLRPVARPVAAVAPRTHSGSVARPEEGGFCGCPGAVVSTTVPLPPLGACNCTFARPALTASSGPNVLLVACTDRLRGTSEASAACGEAVRG